MLHNLNLRQSPYRRNPTPLLLLLLYVSFHTYLVVPMQQIKLEAAREIRDLEGVEEATGDQRGDEVLDRHPSSTAGSSVHVQRMYI